MFFILPVVVILIAPILAMAPVSVTYVLYKMALPRNIRILTDRAAGLEQQPL